MEQTNELRMSGIGGSDAAAILGLNPWKTPLQLAREKLGLESGFGGNEATHWGNRLEDIVGREYALRTGKKITRLNRTLRLKEHPYIMGHIDRRIVGDHAVLECKNVGLRMAPEWGEEGTDSVPPHYAVQGQHYLMFPEVSEYCDFAALIGGQEFRIYNMLPDRELQDMILQAEIKFWQMLQRGELPDPLNGVDCQYRWKAENEASVYASDDVIAWHEELMAATASAKELEEKIEDLQFKIKKFMGAKSVLLDRDGKKLRTWKEQKTAGFDEESFKADHPDLYGRCVVPSFDKSLARKLPEAEHYVKRTRVFR